MIPRLLLLLFALTVALATAAWAEQPNKVPVVGVLTLTAGASDPFVESLRQGLRQLGYVEGRNIRIEFRTANDHPDGLPVLADELVRLTWMSSS